ncbi:MAG TPA: FAD-dependent monooxygenase, partial [Prolixibacteraceae bacterium]
MQAQGADKNVDVLIVGAGPAGLMMACQLAIRNISFRLIDKKEFPTNYSGALILQARSLEIFQQMGIAQSAVQSGVIAKEIKLVFNGDKTFTIPLENFGNGLTQFPYLLLLEQSKSEQLLANFINNLGNPIERKTELDRFTQDESGVTSVLKLPDGQETTVNSKYLIAADGARSTIRKQLQIPFVGKTHPISLFVSDCKAKGNLSSDQLCFLFSDETTTGLFPLTDGKWRIDGVISQNKNAKDLLTFDEVSKSLADKTRVNVEIS